MDTSPTLDDVAQRVSQLETAVGRRLDHIERRLNHPGPIPPPQFHGPRPSQTRPIVPPRTYKTSPGPTPHPQGFPPPPTPPQRAFTPARPLPARPLPTRPLPASTSHKSSFDVTTTLENVMKWAGLTLVSFAAIFLVSTAVTRGWIGPELQLAGATAIGFSLYGVAYFLAPRRHPWASAMVHGATAVTIACAVAAHEWLQLVPVEAGLGLVAIAAAISATVAIRLRTPMATMTSGLGLIGASLVMQIAVRLSPLTAFIWLTVAAFASLLIATLPATSALPSGYSGTRNKFLERWSLQRTIVTWTAAATMLITGIETTVSVGLIICLALMTAALWVGPTLNNWLPFTPSHSLLRPTDQTSAVSAQPDTVSFVTSLDHRLVIGLPLWLWLSFISIFESLTSSDAGIAGGVIGAVFILAVTLSRRFLPASLVTAHLFGTGAVLSIAAVVALDGSAFLVAMTTQAVGVALVGRQLRDRLLQFNAHLLIIIAALVMSANALVDFSQPPTFGTTVGYFTVAAAAFAVAAINKQTFPARTTELYNLFAWILTLIPVLTVSARYLDGYELILMGSAVSTATFYLGKHFGRPTSIFGTVIASVTTLVTVASILEGWTAGLTPFVHVVNLTTIILLAAGTYRFRNHDQTVVYPSALTATWFLAMTWLVSVLVHIPQGQLMVSAAWSVAAGGAILVGVMYGDRVFQVLGMITLTTVLFKLFTVDLQTIDTFWRAGLFFVLGIGFLRLGYQLPKLGRGRRTGRGLRGAGTVDRNSSGTSAFEQPSNHLDQESHTQRQPER